MLDRRHILKLFAGWPLLGGLASSGWVTKASGAARPISPARDYLAELGIRPVINCQGVVTTLTGSLLPPEVVAAMNAVSRHFVNLGDLNEKAGAQMARMLRCEDAMVTCGAASAITLATAAAITGQDGKKIREIPNFSGELREVIVPAGHLVYTQQFLVCGVKIVEVRSAAQMEQAITPRTAIAFYLNKAHPQSVDRAEFLRIAKKHRVPAFIDCASDVPPVENLFKYTEMGFDLVTFSGGKAISGPQSAGLLYGRKNLIEAARLNHSPHQSIGRAMKVSKEEIVGMMVALEVYLKRDHAAEWRGWERSRQTIGDAIKSLPSVVLEPFMPEVANQVPHLRVRWDEPKFKLTYAEAVRRLREGNPAIEVQGGRDSITYNMFMVQPGEAEIVARRSREVLSGGG